MGRPIRNRRGPPRRCVKPSSRQTRISEFDDHHVRPFAQRTGRRAVDRAATGERLPGDGRVGITTENRDPEATGPPTPSSTAGWCVSILNGTITTPASGGSVLDVLTGWQPGLEPISVAAVKTKFWGRCSRRHPEARWRSQTRLSSGNTGDG